MNNKNYKFFSGNCAPKEIEGEYKLIISGNTMTVESANGKTYVADFPDGTTWGFQNGLEAIKSSMVNSKIDIGDVVMFKFFSWRDTVDMIEFIRKNDIDREYILKALKTERAIEEDCVIDIAKNEYYTVVDTYDRFALIYNDNCGLCLFVEIKDIKKCY